eukprot:jgi/Picsp_1/1059/NSC_04543-R1_fibronectin-binding a domain protein
MLQAPRSKIPFSKCALDRVCLLSKHLISQRNFSIDLRKSNTAAELHIERERRSQPQTFDYSFLKACQWDLNDGQVPSRVDGVIQYQTKSLALKLRTLTSIQWLLICWDPVSAHVGTSHDIPRGSPAEVFTFGEQIRNHLKGLILVKAEMPGEWERILKLSFAKRPEQEPEFLLYIELMGKHSNVILCDPKDRIVSAGSQIGAKKSSERQLQIGSYYTLPPVRPGILPEESIEFEQWKACIFSNDRQNTFDKMLCRTFRGVSPSVARELRLRANIQVDQPLEVLDDKQMNSIFVHWTSWLECLENSKYKCHYLDDSQISIMPSACGDKEDDGPLAFFGKYFSSFQTKNESQKVKSSLIKAIRKSKEKLTKKLNSLEEQENSSKHFEDAKRKADMIMSNLHQIRPNQDVLEAEDWETGEIKKVMLDPTKNAVENAEVLYKLARKQKRGAAKILPLKEECLTNSEYLNESEMMVTGVSCEDKDAIEILRQIEFELIANGVIKSSALHKQTEKSLRKARKLKSKSVAGEPRRFLSPSGFEILVGRSSQQNDELSMSIAKPGDVWMHARGVPGAHVIMRSSPKIPSEDDLMFAANLAAYYSKASNLAKVDVSIADPKYLSKSKGAKPGQVVVRKETVIVAKPGHAVAE